MTHGCPLRSHGIKLKQHKEQKVRIALLEGFVKELLYRLEDTYYTNAGNEDNRDLVEKHGTHNGWNLGNITLDLKWIPQVVKRG